MAPEREETPETDPTPSHPPTQVDAASRTASGRDVDPRVSPSTEGESERAPMASGNEVTGGASPAPIDVEVARPPAFRLVAETPTPSRHPLLVLITAPLVTLVALQSLVFLAFLLIEPTPKWIVLFGAAVCALSLHGILRSSIREPFASGADIAPYLFLPTLYSLVMPVFAEQAVSGLWLLPAGAALIAGLATILASELGSARPEMAAYRPSRVIAALGTYAVAFALFDLGYLLDLDVSQAVVAAAVGGALLAVELMREGDVDPLETLGFAAIVGFVAAEARWVLHFLPLEGELAALSLLLVLYAGSELLHAHRTRQLSPRTAGGYAAIVAAGLALVVVASVSGTV